MTRLLAPLLLALTSLGACGPAAPPLGPGAVGRRVPPASAPASLPATRPAPWVTERCRGPLERPASAPATSPAAVAPLPREEAEALKDRGQLLEPARMRHLVVGRGGRVELHRKPAPPGKGNGHGRGNGNRNGAPGPGVACTPVAEADLLPLPGCERVHLCVAEGAYALVVESSGRPALARGATIGLAEWSLRVTPAPDAGEQLVWTATERGLEPAHVVTREEVVRPQGLRLRQVFGRVLASSLGEEGPAARAPASGPAGCHVAPLVVSCGDERYAWDGDAFEYRLAPPPGLQPYRLQELDPGAAEPVRALYAALHAAARLGVGLQRRGFECVEAQTGFELWSRWPVREGKPVGPTEVWRVTVAPRRVTVEILPYAPEDDGRPHVRGVAAGHVYQRERAFLGALRDALGRPADAPPPGLEGFRCGVGFGQPIADVSLDAALDKVRAREQRWRRRCDKTLVEARRAAAAAGGRVRLTCAARDAIARTYDFTHGVLWAVTERYPADVAPRHLRRATERWTARFGEGATTVRPGEPTELAWRWHGARLAALQLADGAVLFVHRREAPDFKLPPPPAPAPPGRKRR